MPPVMKETMVQQLALWVGANRGRLTSRGIKIDHRVSGACATGEQKGTLGLTKLPILAVFTEWDSEHLLWDLIVENIDARSAVMSEEGEAANAKEIWPMLDEIVDGVAQGRYLTMKPTWQ